MLYQNLRNYNLILASNSPRRRDLMNGLGLKFTVGIPFEVDESFPQDMATSQVPIYLSELKSDSYPQSLNDTDILITVDTVVVNDGIILGKPHDKADAIRMLKVLSGGTHSVITGVTIRNNVIKHSFSSRTEVEFDNLSHEKIIYYINNFSPYDKAGSYGIQEWIGYVGVKKINGSFFNVMGLPVHQLYNNLENFMNIVV